MRLTQGNPPDSAFWAIPGLSREDLRRFMDERRHQTARPSESELKADPLLLATADLARRSALRRMRRAYQRGRR